MCIDVNHKKIILRYHLTHDDDKVNNRMTLTVTLLLFNHKHHDLLEQEHFVVIITSESYFM